MNLVCTYICVPVQFVGLTAVLFCPALVLLGRFVQQEIKFVWPFVKLNIYFIHICKFLIVDSEKALNPIYLRNNDNVHFFNSYKLCTCI